MSRIDYSRFSLLVIFLLAQLAVHAQTFDIVLGRPTGSSITSSVMFNQAEEFYFEYGTSSGVYNASSINFTAAPNVPVEADITGLSANTRYYYRLKHHAVWASTYNTSSEYTFHTQRAVGSEFSFTVEADEHLYDKKGVQSIYNICLDNQAKDKPDFMFSLGDTFGDDHTAFTITSDTLDELHRFYRPFLGRITHSVPFYFCLGNHEGENDYYMLQNPPNNLAIMGTLWRKYYYPNPYPNNFYTGNTEVEPYGVGTPENYYAWTWGNALFVVLDVYRNECDTSPKPQGWNWSLGQPQYDWLKTTLEGSQAQYKFVFAHHVRGQGRGGILEAKLYEWGGYEQNGTSYTFPANRPTMAKPIHQLFIDNGVTIFFQGHDHVFAHEVMDNITYQAVPMPSDSTYMIGKLANADAYVSDTLDGTGHIRVKINPTCVKVDYVKAYLPADTLSGQHHNGEIGFTYTLGTCSPTGISKPGLEQAVMVYPNPAKDRLAVQLPQELDNYRIRMLNTLGEEMLDTKSTSIDVHAMPNGIYILSIESSQVKIIRKVIINH